MQAAFPLEAQTSGNSAAHKGEGIQLEPLNDGSAELFLRGLFEPFAEQRMRAVMAPLRRSCAKHVLDLGCGKGPWAAHRPVRVA